MHKKLKELRKCLEELSLLMLTDRQLPSLTSIVAGKPVSGSWWGHPQGNLMYNLANAITDMPDILALKLINKKITYVYKPIWNEIFAIGESQASWQMKNLKSSHLKTLQLIFDHESIRLDDPRIKVVTPEAGKVASLLEERLLLFSESIHSESGKHIRVLKSWKSLAQSRKFKRKKMTPKEACERIEFQAQKLANFSGAKVKLPWN